MHRIIAILVCLALPAGALAQELCTWEDEEGTRHYSTKAPADYECEAVGSANEIMLDPELARAREMARTEAEAEDDIQEQREKRDDGLSEEEHAQACADINVQLNEYQERLSGGEVEMGDDQLQAEMAAMQEVRAQLQQHCNS